MLSMVLVFLITTVLAWILVGSVYKYSHNNAVLATPNERSSHTRPTPTGGGLAIAICLLVAIIVLWQTHALNERLVTALFPSLLVITITGWFDDHQHVRTLVRAIVYFSCALWVVLLLGGFSGLNLGGQWMALGAIGILLAVLGIVWLTNLYNFMDGIDGIAAVQAICTGVFAGILFMYSEMHGLAVLCLILVAACSGYLVWNWPPAKIFMGDVGSCPLGFLFATFSLWSHNNGGPAVYVWLILLSVFIGDATYTLIKRLLSGEKWYSAHKSHAYQKLVLMGYTHRQVTLGVLVINVIALWPLATLAHWYGNVAVYITIFVYLVLALVWWLIQRRSEAI